MEAFISWRQILSTVAENSNSNGIVINPYSGRQALVGGKPMNRLTEKPFPTILKPGSGN